MAKTPSKSTYSNNASPSPAPRGPLNSSQPNIFSEGHQDLNPKELIDPGAFYPETSLNQDINNS